MKTPRLTEVFRLNEGKSGKWVSWERLEDVYETAHTRLKQALEAPEELRYCVLEPSGIVVGDEIEGPGATTVIYKDGLVFFQELGRATNSGQKMPQHEWDRIIDQLPPDNEHDR